MDSFPNLPEPTELRTLIQSQAMLDAILSDDSGEPECAFTEKWGRHRSVAVFNNYQGDDLFIVFDPDHCIVKGTAHEAPFALHPNRVELLKQVVPGPIFDSLKDRTFLRDEATMIAWKKSEESDWHTSSGAIDGVDDGASDLLALLLLTSGEYHEWAEENYERDLPADLVRDIYARAPLTKGMISQLNPDANIASVKLAALRIGYPFD